MYRIFKANKILLLIFSFSFIFHFISVYLVDSFVPLLDPTSFAIKSENFFNFFLPKELFVSSLPSGSVGFYPPGFYLFYNIAFRIFGSQESVIRWIGAIHQIFVPVFVYIIIKRFAGVFISTVVSIMVLFYSVGNAHYYPDYTVLPYSLVLILFLLLYNQNKKTIYLYLSGLICGVIMFLKHNIGLQYFLASLCTLIISEIDFDRKSENNKNYAVILVILFITFFYIFILRKALLLKDIIFFFLPVSFINISLFLLSRNMFLVNKNLLKNIFKFCLPAGIIVSLWLGVYFYYFGIAQYIYRLVFVGYAGFKRIHVDILGEVSLMITSVFYIFINLYILTLKVSEKKYYLIAILFNSLLAFFIFFVIVHFNIKEGFIPILKRLVLYQFCSLWDAMYFSWILNFLVCGIILLKFLKNQFVNKDKIFFILFFFSVFAINSIYPSNDLFHCRMRFPVNLVLFGYLLFLIRNKIPSQRKIVYGLIVSSPFILHEPLTSKITLIKKFFTNEISPYNDKMNVYISNDVINHLDKIKSNIETFIGKEALIIDSYYVQQIYYFIYDLKLIVPYIDLDPNFVEKGVASDIIKRVEENKVKLVILNEFDYKQMITENYQNKNLIPLYKYLNKNFFLKQFISSTPELEKQQLRGSAILLRKNL